MRSPALENVVVTPHIASATRSTRLAMGMLCVEGLRAVRSRPYAAERRVTSRHARFRRLDDRALKRILAHHRCPGRGALASTAGELSLTKRLPLPSTVFRAILGRPGPRSSSRCTIAETRMPSRLRPSSGRSGGRGLAATRGEGRRGEPAALAETLDAAGVPVVGELPAPSFAEGGDTVWLDERTLLVGTGYHERGRRSALGAAFPDVEVVPLTFCTGTVRPGRTHVVHLSLDNNLAVVYPRIAPVRLLRLLADRGIRGRVPIQARRRLERPRARAGARTCARRQQRDPQADEGGGSRGDGLPRRRDLRRRRRADVPDAAAPSRLSSHGSTDPSRVSWR